MSSIGVGEIIAQGIKEAYEFLEFPGIFPLINKRGRSQ